MHFINAMYPNEEITEKNIDNYKFDGKNLSYILQYYAKEMKNTYI